ncbi:hypothetical protein DFH27DRAFT_270346 [Peziza echinospora]|nr:hypothetical protein DFH27DRAFT_270346 [Peziza echinospora]
MGRGLALQCCHTWHRYPTSLEIHLPRLLARSSGSPARDTPAISDETFHVAAGAARTKLKSVFGSRDFGLYGTTGIHYKSVKPRRSVNSKHPADTSHHLHHVRYLCGYYFARKRSRFSKYLHHEFPLKTPFRNTMKESFILASVKHSWKNTFSATDCQHRPTCGTRRPVMVWQYAVYHRSACMAICRRHQTHKSNIQKHSQSCSCTRSQSCSAAQHETSST